MAQPNADHIKITRGIKYHQKCKTQKTLINLS